MPALPAGGIASNEGVTKGKESALIIGVISCLEGTFSHVSILTIYRPNFCTACGAKIIRLRWYLWTSRKFCDACQRQFRREHLVQPILLIVVVLLLGVLLGRSTQRQQSAVVIQRVTSPTTINSQPASQPGAVDDVYSCGARTKKGTPCSRRVHGPGRCWQHKGKPAMLPVEKLQIKE